MHLTEVYLPGFAKSPTLSPNLDSVGVLREAVTRDKGAPCRQSQASHAAGLFTKKLRDSGSHPCQALISTQQAACYPYSNTASTWHTPGGGGHDF